MNFNCYKYIGLLFIRLSWYKCGWKVDLTIEFNTYDQPRSQAESPNSTF